MSQSGQEGSPPCNKSQPSNDSSAVSEEGQWLGISLGALLLLIVLAWCVRTCRQPQRRKQMKNKLLSCLGLQKHDDDNTADTQQQQQSTSSSASSKHANGSLSRCENGSAVPVTNGSVSYSGNHCNAFHSSKSNGGFTLGDVLRREFENNDDDDDDDDDNDDECDEYDENELERAWKGNGNGDVKNGGKFRKRPSRASLHSLSITLETIQEDLNETRHSSEPEIRIQNDVTNGFAYDCVGRKNNKGPTTPRSMSVPARLCGMINNILEEPPDVENNNNNDYDVTNPNNNNNHNNNNTIILNAKNLQCQS